MFATVYGGGIWRSVDSGATWTQINSTARNYTGICMSNDGTKIYVCVKGGSIYYSANALVTTPTFTEQNPSTDNQWTGVCCSSDGSTAYCAEQFAGIFKTTNSGTNWALSKAGDYAGIKRVRCSSDGAVVCAAVENYTPSTPGGILVSLDSGSTWNMRIGSGEWFDVSINRGGTSIIAFKGNGSTYKSKGLLADNLWETINIPLSYYSGIIADDGVLSVVISNGNAGYTPTMTGVTWAARESNRNWVGVASSADGTKLVACVHGGQIYTSVDSGVTWTARESNRYWYSVASSADGTKLVAVAQSGKIYTSRAAGDRKSVV